MGWFSVQLWLAASASNFYCVGTSYTKNTSHTPYIIAQVHLLDKEEEEGEEEEEEEMRGLQSLQEVHEESR